MACVQTCSSSRRRTIIIHWYVCSPSLVVRLYRSFPTHPHPTLLQYSVARFLRFMTLTSELGRRELIFVRVSSRNVSWHSRVCVLHCVAYHSISNMRELGLVNHLIAKALVERILRAARDQQRFKVRGHEFQPFLGGADDGGMLSVGVDTIPEV